MKDNRKKHIKEKAQKKRTPQEIKEIKITVVFVSVVILVIIGIFAFSHIRWKNHFSYEKSLDETLFTYSGGKAKLRDITYYIMIEEEAVNEAATAYDADNVKAYWNLHINNSFVSDEAKQKALDYCTRDILYAQLAREEGIEVTIEQDMEIQKKTKNILEGLTEKQKALGLTGEDIYTALVNNQLADNYVIWQAEERELTMTEKVLSAYYGINSKFFQTTKGKAEFKLNKDLWAEITLGDLTIENE